MKKIYPLLFILYVIQAKAQVQDLAVNSTWIDSFESMTAGLAPTNGWQANVNGFTVSATPHSIMGTKALTKELTGNSGSDSILTSYFRNSQGPHEFSFFYRINNWSGGTPVSAATMPSGDTCYVYCLKYLGSSVVATKVLDKIYGAFTFGTNFNVGKSYNFNPMAAPFANNSDTVGFKIKIVHGASSTYTYDFDYFMVGIPLSVAEIQSQNENVKVFPNPAQNFVWVSSELGINKVQVKNSMGQTVFYTEKQDNFDHEKLDLRQYQSGMYFIEITSKNGTETVQKLIRN